MKDIKNSFLQLQEKKDHYKSKYRNYLMKIYKEIIKINCMVCDLDHQKNFIYQANSTPQFTVYVEGQSEIRRYFKRMKDFDFFKDIKVLINFFICVKYQLNYNSTELESNKMYDKIFHSMEDNMDDLIYQEK